MPDSIHFTLRFPGRIHHHLEVEAVYPASLASDRGRLTLMMPVWTPGSYLVREFARQVEGLAAWDAAGGRLPAAKVRKNRWRIEAGGAGAVRVTYRVYARELAVRTNFVDAELALVNGAATFLAPLAGDRPAPGPYELRVELPDGWAAVECALRRQPDAAGDSAVSFLAADFDTLVDAPLVAGNPAVRELGVAGVPHRLVDVGADPQRDTDRAARDFAAVAEAERRFWGAFPYPRYLVLNVVAEGRGGLEHCDSAVLMAGRGKNRSRDGWLSWLSLAAHELFHAWHGKRLRPVELGPFDYETEVYTPSLWAVEGFTAYYDDLLVHRAGLSTRDEYLDRLAENFDKLDATPGRDAMSLSEGSFDAWIEHYRQDENSVNSTVSYYLKGAVLAFVLDAALRRGSDGGVSLDVLLREAYRRWSGDRGYTEGELIALAGELGGPELAAWLEDTVHGTGELDLVPALATFGLRRVEKKRGVEAGDPGRPAVGPREPPGRPGWLGADTEVREGRLWISAVLRGTPAWAAGLNVEDEILALDGYRVPPAGWVERFRSFRPGQPAELTVARRERLLVLPVVFGDEPRRPTRLEVDPSATAGQTALLADWLAGRPFPEDEETPDRPHSAGG